jgi:predicted RNA-binding Zn ribbon-like protein
MGAQIMAGRRGRVDCTPCHPCTTHEGHARSRCWRVPRRRLVEHGSTARGAAAAVTCEMMTSVAYDALLHPEDDRPAPGPLVLVQALVNTRDRSTGEDALATTGAASAWLARAGLRGPVSGAEAERLRAVRDALRDLLAVNAGLEADAPAAAALDAAAGRMAVTVGPDGAVSLGGEGTAVERMLGDLLAAIHDAQVAVTWPRLKVCADAGCRWAFYDGSRNRAGSWCSMAECGNRAKAQRFRSRRAAGAVTGPGRSPGPRSAGRR